MLSSDIADDLTSVLYTEAQIHERIAQLARSIEADYAGEDVLLVEIGRAHV